MNLWDLVIVEALEIQLDKDAFKCDTGLHLSRSWLPLMALNATWALKKIAASSDLPKETIS